MTRSRSTEAIDLPEIQSWDEVPEFRSEAEEREFWDTHAFGEGLWTEVDDPGLPPPRPRSRPLSIRLDADTLARLKKLAEKKHKGYQTLLKEFVAERLYEEEVREGIIERQRAS